MDDRQIISLFFQRDEQALTETDRKYHRYCRKIAVQILQDQEDADEALNDTWFAAWNSIPPHEPAHLQTFLGRLTRNVSLKKLRAHHAKSAGTARHRSCWTRSRTGCARSRMSRRMRMCICLRKRSMHFWIGFRRRNVRFLCAGTGIFSRSQRSRRASDSLKARSNPCSAAFGKSCTQH